MLQNKETGKMEANLEPPHVLRCNIILPPASAAIYNNFV